MLSPSFLVIVADAWSFPYAGLYGDRLTKTPHVDRLVREGTSFTHAFVASASGGPSRAALLTGQHPHRLGEAANERAFLPPQHECYPDLLERAQMAVGFSGQGWGPGKFEAGGRKRNPAGQPYKSFSAFLQALPAGKAFSFWYGSQALRRPFAEPAGPPAARGELKLPPYWVDTEETRQDLRAYVEAIGRFDTEVGELLAQLQASGRAASTFVVVTSAAGLPFPRGEANLYDPGTRVPLVVRGPEVKAGRKTDALVSLIDLAPTFLEGSGRPVPPAMTGRSLLSLLRAVPGAEKGRDQVFIERERHLLSRANDGSYPSRGLRTRDHLYIRNLRSDRWPAGDPSKSGEGGHDDCAPSPTKEMVVGHKDDETFGKAYALALGKRPAEELYDVRRDPLQVVNLAGKPAQAAVARRLRADLERWMKETGDPRVDPQDDRYDRTNFFGG